MELLIGYQLIGSPKLRRELRGPIHRSLYRTDTEIMEESQSLRSLFQSARDGKTELETRGDTNTEAYRDAVNATTAKFHECQRQISILSLFSSNESLDDVSTGDLPLVQHFLFAAILADLCLGT